MSFLIRLLVINVVLLKLITLLNAVLNVASWVRVIYQFNFFNLTFNLDGLPRLKSVAEKWIKHARYYALDFENQFEFFFVFREIPPGLQQSFTDWIRYKLIHSFIYFHCFLSRIWKSLLLVNALRTFRYFIFTFIFISPAFLPLLLAFSGDWFCPLFPIKFFPFFHLFLKKKSLFMLFLTFLSVLGSSSVHFEFCFLLVLFKKNFLYPLRFVKHF